MKSTFHDKITVATVQAALEKCKTERPNTYQKLKEFILEAPSLAFNAPTTGAVLPGNDNRTHMGNVGRFTLFLKEVGPWFAEQLGVRQEIEARTTDKSEDWPGTCLAIFTWDAIAPVMESGGESVTFVLRPEYALAHQQMIQAAAEN